MFNEITFDENGKVASDSKIYNKLDKWHDEDKYDDIVKTVMDIPREKWSNKLWFRLISAYNNLGETDKAQEELAKIEPFCTTPADVCKMHYMRGYIHYSEDREHLAIIEYFRGLNADPDNTSGLDLEKEIKDCRQYIKDDLAKLRSLSEKVYSDVRKKCEENPDKTELNDQEFTLYLGYLPAMRVIPGQEKAMGFSYFRKYEGREKEICFEGLKRRFGITDSDSFKQFYKNSPYCNINPIAEEVRAYIAGTPRSDIDGMPFEDKYFFGCYREFIGVFNEFLPKAGLLAWDISEKVGFLRLAYACDILSNTDYSAAMLYLHDLARESFSSFEEYMLSLAFGASLFMFVAERMNLISAIDYLAKTALELYVELPKLHW